MKNWLRLTSLALPLVALAASWAFTHHKAQQGTIWAVPVSGYDPRDLLRGHYITYRYNWPGMPAQDGRDYISAVCIKGTAPVINTATSLNEFGMPPSQARPECTIVARTAPGSVSENGLANGKIYIAQTKAAGLERQLADPKFEALIHVRIRDDGIVTPLELEFRPRPVVPPQ